MRKKLQFRYLISFVLLIFLLCFFIVWNINAGSIDISLKEVFDILFCRNGQETAYNIVWEIRMPRILAAVILGGALSVSGFLLQTFFGNPIAGPFVLGISSGAKLVVALVMINIVNLHNWSLGSFSGTSWDNVKVMTIVVVPVLIITFLMSKPIGAYQLGEGYAQNMCVNSKVFRVALILLSSILSACVTAFAGPISFVGIAVPHLVKSLLKTSKPILVIPACFLGGAVFCLFCDLIARTVFAPTELSISSVTAVFGAPIVIYIMIHRKRNV